MKQTKLYARVSAAMLAALTCITTLILVIPIPFSMGGYINLGDCLVLLGGWLLGPIYGCAAAAIGSLLADVFTGYLAYAPATLIVKGLMAVFASLLFQWGARIFRNHILPARFFSALISEVFMVIGYFFYESLLLGNGVAAAASMPWNLLQGGASMLLAVPLGQRLTKTRLIQKWGQPTMPSTQKKKREIYCHTPIQSIRIRAIPHFP